MRAPVRCSPISSGCADLRIAHFSPIFSLVNCAEILGLGRVAFLSQIDAGDDSGGVGAP
jgi:hypothetical protein